MKTAVWIMEDRIQAVTGMPHAKARHLTLEVIEALSEGGFTLVAGPPPGFRLQLVETAAQEAP